MTWDLVRRISSQHRDRMLGDSLFTLDDMPYGLQTALTTDGIIRRAGGTNFRLTKHGRKVLAPSEASPSTCCDCREPLGKVFFGAGDGRGQRYRCGSCHALRETQTLRARVAELEREREEARGLLEKAIVHLRSSEERLASIGLSSGFAQRVTDFLEKTSS